MVTPWTFAGGPAPLDSDGGAVTVVYESTFAISTSSGDILPGGAQGLFFRDKRIVSRLEIVTDDNRLEPLTAYTPEPFAATFVSRHRPAAGRADSSVMVFRSRYVGRGMREDLTVRNFGAEATVWRAEIVLDADFADLFAVKEGRAGEPDGEVTWSADKGVLSASYQKGDIARGVCFALSWPGAEEPAVSPPLPLGPPGGGFGALPPPTLHVRGKTLALEVVVPAKGSWTGCLSVSPVMEGKAVRPRYHCGQPVERSAPSERLAEWRQRVPQVQTDHEGLQQVISRSAEDLGALRIFDPDYPDRVVLAAGAPWFMTVFGRDSLLTAWSALLVDQDLALGVLQTLARFQGTQVDPRNDEQPGRILHEMRFGDAPSLSLGGGSIYYGSVDATPLFVMLLGELRRWGLASALVDELLPNADRAVAWIEEFGDADKDGYVEYRRGTDRGLANQGWKDSWDGIRYRDGRVAEAPIALCEVQAYVYSAFVARAHFAHEAGDAAGEQRFRAKAAALKKAFNQDFWLDQHGWLAVGLDADKKPIDSLTSNIGHCLWTGILEEDKAAAIAERLLSPEMFTGWGVRTLAASMGGYNPVSYHCGSVWPHDTAIVAAGLARYGFVEGAQRLVLGLLDAAVAQGGRLPELFSGLDRSELAVPVAYPTSCSPQAWSAASPLLALRTLLRLDPWIPRGKTWIAPIVPEEIGALRVEGIPLAGARVDVEVSDGRVKVDGLPPAIELLTSARQPETGP